MQWSSCVPCCVLGFTMRAPFSSNASSKAVRIMLGIVAGCACVRALLSSFCFAAVFGAHSAGSSGKVRPPLPSRLSDAVVETMGYCACRLILCASGPPSARGHVLVLEFDCLFIATWHQQCGQEAQRPCTPFVASMSALFKCVYSHLPCVAQRSIWHWCEAFSGARSLAVRTLPPAETMPPAGRP